MTVGDIAIYREATAGDDEDNTSPHNMTYDTTVREDAATYNLETGNEDITLSDIGHYLVLFNEIIDTVAASTERFVSIGEVYLSDVGQNVSAGGYARNTQDCDELYIAGSGIIATEYADEYLNIVLQKTSTATVTSATRRAGVGGVQVIKLYDTWDYFMATSSTDVEVLSLGDDILWEGVTEEDSGSYALQVDEKSIELQQGYYLCCYTVSFTCTNITAGRVGAVAYLELGGTEVIGSRSMNYGRLTQGAASNRISCICLIDVNTATQDLILKTAVSARYGGGQINDDGTSIQIVKLPDDTLAKAWVYDGTGSYTVAATSLTDIPMDDEIDVDTGSFTHSTVSNTDEIFVDADGDYLFMYNIYAQSTSGTTINRYDIYSRFEYEDSAQAYGNAGCFFRGFVSSPDTRVPNCGCSHGFIGNGMSANEGVNIATQRENASVTANPPATVANKSAFSAIQLSSIFPASDNLGSYWFAQQGF